MEKITNPWCTYDFGFGPSGFGKVVRETGDIVNIIYSESQHYPSEPWESNCVKRFSTLEQAIENYIENRPRTEIRDKEFSPEEIKQEAMQKFPSYFENKE